MIRRLIILLLIVGCGIFDNEETNICVQSSLNFHQTYCYDWTDSEDTCTISGFTFLMDSTCESYCSDIDDCRICNNSNPECP